MKTWITVALALTAILFAAASWLEATTNSYPPISPKTFIEESSSDPEALEKAVHVARQCHLALNQIKVINSSPEELRAAFIHYWSLRLTIDTAMLSPSDQERIRTSLRNAHLTRTKALTADISTLPPSLDLQHLVAELARGVEATARF